MKNEQNEIEKWKIPQANEDTRTMSRFAFNSVELKLYLLMKG